MSEAIDDAPQVVDTSPSVLLPAGRLVIDTIDTANNASLLRWIDEILKRDIKTVNMLSMPGTPQVWYLDLFAGVNDDEAADRGGSGGHKEINRTNLTDEYIEAGMQRSGVLDQLEMMRFRNTSDAFRGKLTIIPTEPNRLGLRWAKGATQATLDADLRAGTFSITHIEAGQQTVFSYV